MQTNSEDSTQLAGIGEIRVTPGLAFRLANWLVNNDTSVSCKFMAGVALNGAGYRSKWPSLYTAPSDAAELGRCVRLVTDVPEVRPAAFAILRGINPVWGVYVEQWDRLAATWRVGDYNATTNLLRELRAEANAERGARNAEPSGARDAVEGRPIANLQRLKAETERAMELI